jgi:hypothetical protein
MFLFLRYFRYWTRSSREYHPIGKQATTKKYRKIREGRPKGPTRILILLLTIITLLRNCKFQ